MKSPNQYTHTKFARATGRGLILLCLIAWLCFQPTPTATSQNNEPREKNSQMKKQMEFRDKIMSNLDTIATSLKKVVEIKKKANYYHRKYRTLKAQPPIHDTFLVYIFRDTCISSVRHADSGNIIESPRMNIFKRIFKKHSKKAEDHRKDEIINYPK